ncbi:MAG: pitrilysin family protein [candidate division Zixibacteria bacterium]|nr:pitrilysin family protein [candidate division Zixibacteria bacterium]
MNHRHQIRLLLLILILAAVSTAFAFDFSQFEKKVVEYNLDNGLKILVLPRHDAPVVSFITMVNAGGADDPKGGGGTAHLFEHMAFKGTKDIGTTNLQKELKWMDEEDRIDALLRAEKAKRDLADTIRIASLQAELQKAIDSAVQFVKANEFMEIAEREGGTGLNAGTGYDITAYMGNYPANRLELWMALESDRFINPVLRELYKERDVIGEERRMTRESSPQGKLRDELFATAFVAHPYHNSLIGPMSDIQNFNRASAMAFYKKYYVPSNMVVVIVGDVNPEEVLALAKKYLGKIPAGPKPEPILTVEPPQVAEKRVTLNEKTQPVYFKAFHIPDANHPDRPALDALADYLGQGRTSLLYRTLVKDLKIATTTVAFAGFPGNKYPSLFAIVALPSKDRTNAENDAEILKIIEKVKTETISQEEVDKIKARSKASLINNLSSNEGLAMQLAMYQTIAGDWRRLYREMQLVEAITPEDINRVANKYLDTKASTTVTLESEEK